MKGQFMPTRGTTIKKVMMLYWLCKKLPHIIGLEEIFWSILACYEVPDQGLGFVEVRKVGNLDYFK